MQAVGRQGRACSTADGALQHKVEVSGAFLQVPESHLSAHSIESERRNCRHERTAARQLCWDEIFCAGPGREIIPDRDSSQRDIGDEHGLYLLPQLRCLSHGLSADDLGAIRAVLWNSIMSNCFCCLDGDRLVASV